VDADLIEVRERARFKEAILADLAGGRLTLREAAEQCREVTPPPAWSAHLGALHFYYPGLTDEGCVCRNLFAGVRTGPAAPAAERLEWEWRAMVRNGDDVFFLTP
jgi:hypothetical protein